MVQTHVQYINRINAGQGLTSTFIIVRAILGLYNAFSILAFRNGVERAFGRHTANWYLILQATQFHIIYYASRTLPNMFAFGMSITIQVLLYASEWLTLLGALALRGLLPTAPSLSNTKRTSKRLRLSIGLLTVAGVVFRSELAILLATQTVYLLYRKRVSLREVISAGVAGALLGLMFTVPIDSVFWLKFPLWPELAGFYYNAIKGSSSEWGTSPWNFYFTNALPRLMMNPLTWQVCIPLAIGLKATASIDILIPLVAFVGIYSVQPHKEWRFIIYTIPGFTAVAAIGASWIWTRRSKTLTYRVLSLALVASTVASFAVSAGMLAISRLNYPGAEALSRVHELGRGPRIVSVHMDTLSCTTGITRFLEKPPPQSIMSNQGSLWIYDKTEDPQTLLRPAFWERFDYALTERPEKVIGRWEIVEVVNGFAGIRILKPEETDDFEGGSLVERFFWKRLDTNPFDALKQLWSIFELLMRKHITRGWWVGAKMEPKIRILRKQTGPYNITPP